jgi:hypothetical protein
MLLRTCCLAAALGLRWAVPATAAPPDAIDVHDTLFGISDRQIFVLRTAVDNLGLHVASHAITLLVATVIETGAELIWPVYVTRSMPDYESEVDTDSSVTDVLRPSGRADPFAVLATLGAITVSPRFTWAKTGLLEGGLSLPEARIDTEKVVVSRQGRVTQGHETAVLLYAMAVSLAALSEHLGEYDRFGGQPSAGALLTGRNLDAANCRVGEPLTLATPSAIRLVTVVRFSCRSDVQMTSLIYVLGEVDD